MLWMKREREELIKAFLNAQVCAIVCSSQPLDAIFSENAKRIVKSHSPLFRGTFTLTCANWNVLDEQ